MTAAIIVASGTSQRMGFDKLLAPLNGWPVLWHSIKAFRQAKSIGPIIVVCPQDRWQQLDLSGIPDVTRVDGGDSRQDSVQCGLDALPDDIRHVAVHDGARPLVSAHDIDRCVVAAQEHGAATLARRVTETMKRADADDFSGDAVSREHLWSMETPQAFELESLVDAYAKVRRDGLTVTDEVSALQAIGRRVKFIPSEHPNLKITTPSDLALAAALLNHPA